MVANLNSSRILFMSVLEKNSDLINFLLKSAVTSKKRIMDHHKSDDNNNNIDSLSVSYDCSDCDKKEDQSFNDNDLNKSLVLKSLDDLENFYHQEDLNHTINTQRHIDSSITALHIAARYAKIACAHLFFIKNGPSADRLKKYGETPLMSAVVEGDYDLVSMFLSNGAQPDQYSELGLTPLHQAAQLGETSMVELLLSYGASINATDRKGFSVLHHAALGGHENVVQLLLNHGCEINVQDDYGFTPLHIAVKQGNSEMVKYMLMAGADASIANVNGATSLHYAVVLCYPKIVAAIVRNGLDFNIVVKNGELDLSAFEWISEQQLKSAYELFAKYQPKKNLFTWYNAMLKNVYEKSKSNRSNLLKLKVIE